MGKEGGEGKETFHDVFHYRIFLGGKGKKEEKGTIF